MAAHRSLSRGHFWQYLNQLLMVIGTGFVLVFLLLYLHIERSGDIDEAELNRHTHIQDEKGGRAFLRVIPGVLAYSAFLDTRTENRTIRIIALVNQVSTKRGYCHFWPPDSVPPPMSQSGRIPLKLNSHKEHGRLSHFLKLAWKNLSRPLEFYETCEGHGLRNVAYYASCEVPKDINYTLSSVVISRARLQVVSSAERLEEFPITEMSYRQKHIGEQRQVKTNFSAISIGVCVPPLFGDLSADSLVEFIELTRILGADHFVFYDYEISKSVKKLLGFYEQIGVVTVLPWDLPLNDNEVWYHGQSATIADCLFRTMGKFDWVLFQDVDEFVIPRETNSLRGFLEAYEAWDATGFVTIASLRFPSTVFHKTSTLKTNVRNKRFITMLSTMRTESVSYTLTKQMVRPERVFELGIHHLSKSTEEVFIEEFVDEGKAMLYHYRHCISKFSIDCGEFIVDQTMHRYFPELLRRTLSVMSQIE